MKRKIKTFIAASLVLFLCLSVLPVHSLVLAQRPLPPSIPKVALYAIKNGKTWEDYTETDLQEIGCRYSEVPYDFPYLSELNTADKFLNFLNKLKGTKCELLAGRYLGVWYEMFYVLRARKDYSRITIFGPDDEKYSFDICIIGKDKGEYCELSGSFVNTTADLWEIQASNVFGEKERLFFYLATDDFNEFNAALSRFAGFILYEDANVYSTFKEGVSPLTQNFAFFSSPSFCVNQLGLESLLKDIKNKVAVWPLDPIGLTENFLRFVKTLFSSQDIETDLFLKEVISRRQITPYIALKLKGGGMNLGISNLDVITNVATSGYAVCQFSTTTLLSEVTNYSNESWSGGNVLLSISSIENPNNRQERQLSLGTINAFTSKNYSMDWLPTATGFYSFQAALDVSDGFSNDNSASIMVEVLSPRKCEEIGASKKYYCHVGFCYECPRTTVPPSKTCKLVPNSVCEVKNIPCKPKGKE